MLAKILKAITDPQKVINNRIRSFSLLKIVTAINATVGGKMTLTIKVLMNKYASIIFDIVKQS